MSEMDRSKFPDAEAIARFRVLQDKLGVSPLCPYAHKGAEERASAWGNAVTVVANALLKLPNISGAKAKRDYLEEVFSDRPEVEHVYQLCAKLAFDGRVNYHISKDEMVNLIGRASTYSAIYGSAPTEVIEDQIRSVGDMVLIGDVKHLTESERMFYLLAVLASDRLRGAKRDLAVRMLVGESKFSQQVLDLLVAITDRRLGGGMAASAYNKIWPDAIYQMKVMLAKPYDVKRIKQWPVACERKLDGVRAIIEVELAKGDPEKSGPSEYMLMDYKIVSRTGKRFESFEPVLRSAAVELAIALVKGMPVSGEGSTGVMIDAEIFSKDFQKTVSAAQAKASKCEDAVIYAFDWMPLKEFLGHNCATPNFKRFESLRHAVQSVKQNAPEASASRVELIKRYMANSDSEVQLLFKGALESGVEGLIVKPLHHKYAFRRSFDWMKLKAEESVDVRVTGVVEGTGKYVGVLGALIVDVDGVEVNVGTGLSDDQRRLLWADANAGHLIGRTVEVEYHEKTPDGSLRHPRFKRFRDDKAAAAAA